MKLMNESVFEAPIPIVKSKEARTYSWFIVHSKFLPSQESISLQMNRFLIAHLQDRESLSLY